MVDTKNFMCLGQFEGKEVYYCTKKEFIDNNIKDDTVKHIWLVVVGSSVFAVQCNMIIGNAERVKDGWRIEKFQKKKIFITSDTSTTDYTCKTMDNNSLDLNSESVLDIAVFDLGELSKRTDEMYQTIMSKEI